MSSMKGNIGWNQGKRNGYHFEVRAPWMHHDKQLMLEFTKEMDRHLVKSEPPQPTWNWDPALIAILFKNEEDAIATKIYVETLS